MSQVLKVICVCGARPNFMKIAPIMEQIAQRDGIEALLVHTGQHYDRKMSELFFDELRIPKPDINLEVGSGSHAGQTADVMKRFEPICISEKPDWVIVVGDVNSTLACALVAAKLGIRVAHVEAGLRSFDRSMPEEINRLLTDAVSDLLLVSEPSGMVNLSREGIDSSKVHFVGNVMIDTLLRSRQQASRSDILERLKLAKNNYAVVTLHRPSNVDNKEALAEIFGAFRELAAEMPIVFPIHPRTRKNLIESGLDVASGPDSGLHLVDPLGYLDFTKLMADAAVVLTDSGGIQEETTILGVPCLTIRENTERPITLVDGTNRLVEANQEAITNAWRDVRANPPQSDACPELWDGKAAARIVECLAAASSKDKARDSAVALDWQAGR